MLILTKRAIQAIQSVDLITVHLKLVISKFFAKTEMTIVVGTIYRTDQIKKSLFEERFFNDFAQHFQILLYYKASM